tara:strand:- start:844 stop:1230 length:387 start_codon:yes stop_codon:yes gene_type:complete
MEYITDDGHAYEDYEYGKWCEEIYKKTGWYTNALKFLSKLFKKYDLYWMGAQQCLGLRYYPNDEDRNNKEIVDRFFDQLSNPNLSEDMIDKHLKERCKRRAYFIFMDPDYKKYKSCVYRLKFIKYKKK